MKIAHGSALHLIFFGHTQTIAITYSYMYSCNRINIVASIIHLWMPLLPCPPCLIFLFEVDLAPLLDQLSAPPLTASPRRLRWRSSSNKEYCQSLPPFAKRVEGGCLLVVRYLAMQFVEWVHPANDATGTRPPGSAVVVACAVITTSDSIWENGPYFTMTDIKSILPFAHARPPPLPSLLGTLHAVPSSLLVTVANTSTLRNALVAPAHPPKLQHHPQSRWTICSTCPPRPPLSRRQLTLLRTSHLRPQLHRSNSGRLSVFVRWLSRRPGMPTRRVIGYWVIPLSSHTFSDFCFSPPKRHPSTIGGNKDWHSQSAKECICIAGLQVGHKRMHHILLDLRSAPAAPTPPPGERRRPTLAKEARNWAISRRYLSFFLLPILPAKIGSSPLLPDKDLCHCGRRHCRATAPQCSMIG